MRSDVIVVGLGAMGSAAAWQLAKRGKSVLGLERFTPAHDLGSSHGDSRIIRLAYFEDPAYVPLLQRAYELWRELESESGSEVFTQTGGLMIGPHDSEPVAGAKQSAEEWNLSHELLLPDEVHRRFPNFRLDEEEVAFYEEPAGFVRPERACLAFQQEARRHGAELRFEEPLVSWKAEAGGVTVETTQGTYHAERLVIATGAWNAQWLKELDLPLEVQRLTLFWFRPQKGLDAWQPDRMPIYIWEPRGGDQFYGFPALDAREEAAKIAYFRVGPTCDPDTVDRVVSEMEVQRMRKAFASRLPDLNGELLDAKTCLYTNTPDGHFVLGVHPEFPQVSLAAGFSGHGFKFTSVMGEVLADLAESGQTRHPIQLFDPSRFRSGV